VSDVRWLGDYAVDGDVVFRIGRDGADYVAEWIGLCELRTDRSGAQVVLRAAEGADARVVAKVERGSAAALIRHLRGETSLHASCVAVDGRAVVLLGSSGAGKSTFAAWMCRRPDTALVSDDILHVDIDGSVALARPTEIDHWLEPASLAALGIAIDAPTKEPTRAARSTRERSPIAAAVVLRLEAPDAAISLSPLHGQRAVEALVRCVVRFVLDEPERQLAEIAWIERALRTIPVYELRFPRRFDAMDEAVALVRTLLDGGPR
jgi:serine kinase of HPr protein (carbohydrate metabolism regulator)